MKILIFFCDGLPNAQGYGGKVAKEDLQKVQRQLKQKQITLFVAAIGRDQEDIQNIYGMPVSMRRIWNSFRIRL